VHRRGNIKGRCFFWVLKKTERERARAGIKQLKILERLLLFTRKAGHALYKVSLSLSLSLSLSFALSLSLHAHFSSPETS
jgi:hypothetical protein